MYKGKEPVRERPELAEDDLRGSDRTFNLPTLAPELWVARHPGDGLRAPGGAHESLVCVFDLGSRRQAQRAHALSHGLRLKRWSAYDLHSV